MFHKLALNKEKTAASSVYYLPKSVALLNRQGRSERRTRKELQRHVFRLVLSFGIFELGGAHLQDARGQIATQRVPEDRCRNRGRPKNASVTIWTNF